MKDKVALVTGASSGIGRETALELAERGFRIYGAARRIDRMADLAEEGVITMTLDVTDEDSMAVCVQAILEEEGHIDVLVNNAGYGSYGAIEDVPLAEARNQLDVNLFGMARMTQLVLPSMRAHHFGKIVNISSMAGKVPTPFGGWYHATKFAVEGFSDCLRMELAPFGIDVIIIEPGAIKTAWGLIAADNLREVSGHGAYAEAANRVADGLTNRYTGSGVSDPTLISRTIGQAVTAVRPKTRYLIGYGARLSVIAKRLLSDRAFDALIQRVMG
jgi:NAD(P)-dependent dehydrogenase (short-subunit alcohol dehydrogenase family)